MSLSQFPVLFYCTRSLSFIYFFLVQNLRYSGQAFCPGFPSSKTPLDIYRRLLSLVDHVSTQRDLSSSLISLFWIGYISAAVVFRLPCSVPLWFAIFSVQDIVNVSTTRALASQKASGTIILWLAGFRHRRAPTLGIRYIFFFFLSMAGVIAVWKSKVYSSRTGRSGERGEGKL